MHLLQFIKEFINTSIEPDDPYEENMTEANNVPQLNTEDESQPVDNQASVEAPHDPDEAKIDSFITKFKAGIKIVENVTDEAIEDVAEFVKKYV